MTAADKTVYATREVVLSRMLDAPRELVFRLWTEPGHMAQFWGPKSFTNPVCEVDLRAGGAFRVEMRGPMASSFPAPAPIARSCRRSGSCSRRRHDSDDKPVIAGSPPSRSRKRPGKTKITVRASGTAVEPTARRFAGWMRAGTTASTGSRNWWQGRSSADTSAPDPPVCSSSFRRGRSLVVGAGGRRLGRRLRPHLVLRRPHRRDDVLIAGAAAEVRRQHVEHVLVADVGVLLQRVHRQHQEARRAEAALQAVMRDERALQRMQRAVLRQSLDGADLLALRLHREHQARAHRLVADDDGAGAADAVLAADVRAGQPAILADRVDQRLARLDADVVLAAVDGEREVDFFGHVQIHARQLARRPPRASSRSRAQSRADGTDALRDTWDPGRPSP